jgi:4-hydroxyphenylpyruvate dioxygenase-like putative hemolysin
MALPFQNDDKALREGVDRVMNARKKAGLEGLVGGLEAVEINVQPANLRVAAEEFLGCTGHHFHMAYEHERAHLCVLRQEGSADFLFTSRKDSCSPFAAFNMAPKSKNLPETRLETFIFKCPDVERFAALQMERGNCFLTAEPLRTDKYVYIQTPPSRYTGNSIGFIQWLGAEGDWFRRGCGELNWKLEKPDKPHLSNVHELDHTATRVRAEERDRAILEFMDWTNYSFDFAVYVEALNSITNVARLSADDFAMVFTSGISPFTTLEESGPTEKYIYNYNTRVHHLAFSTVNIEETYAAFKREGMEFLVELVGGPDEGLHQTFTKPFPTTLLVNEYIQRYGGFDGFFTKSNVTMLTAATDNQ